MSGAPIKPWQQSGQAQSQEPKPWDVGQPADTSMTALGTTPSKPWESPMATTGAPGYGLAGGISNPYASGSSTGYQGYTSPYSYRQSFYGAQTGLPTYGSYTSPLGSSYAGGMYGSYSPYASTYGQPLGSSFGPYGYQNSYGQHPGFPAPPGGVPAPPTSWQALLAGLNSLVNFFGRVSFLVEENSHAVHFFVTALLQLLDRVGSLYTELARFILRLLGYKPPPKKPDDPGGAGPPQPGVAIQPPVHAGSGVGGVGGVSRVSSWQQSASPSTLAGSIARAGPRGVPGLPPAAGSTLSQSAAPPAALGGEQQGGSRWDKLWKPVQSGSEQ